MLARTSGAVRLLRAFGSLASFTLHSSFRCLTLSSVRSVSPLFHPLRCCVATERSPTPASGLRVRSERQRQRISHGRQQFRESHQRGQFISALGGDVKRISAPAAGMGIMRNMNRAALLISLLAVSLTLHASPRPAGRQGKGVWLRTPAEAATAWTSWLPSTPPRTGGLRSSTTWCRAGLRERRPRSRPSSIIWPRIFRPQSSTSIKPRPWICNRSSS